MEELIKRALEKNQDAYSKIYEQTHNNVAFTIRVLLKDDAAVDDILQETYITAFQKLAMLKDPEKINAWICKIAKNKTIDYLRKNKEIAYLNEPIENEQGDLEEIDLPEDRVEFIPEKQMDKNENSRLLMDILNSLPQEQRVCVISFYYEQQSIKEIAEEVNCNEETVKSRIRYAKKKIKEQVEQLKKTGTHLYGVAPIPFFVWLLKDAGESYQYSGGVTGVQIATSSMASTLSANTATIEMGKMSSAVTAKEIAQGTGTLITNGKKAGSLGVKLKTLSVGQKIAVGLVSTGVTVGAIGGGVVGYQHLQANAVIEANTEEESEFETEDIDVSQIVEVPETEAVETEELVIDYVSLLDQIDQLTPSDAVEVLRQYCENGVYAQHEFITTIRTDGNEELSTCDEFGFVYSVLGEEGEFNSGYVYHQSEWYDPESYLHKELAYAGYVEGHSLEEVNVGSLIVRNEDGDNNIFYVNNVLAESYEVLYWSPEMVAQKDFQMSSMYKSMEEMENMLKEDYTLYFFDDKVIKRRENSRVLWNVEYVYEDGVIINVDQTLYNEWTVQRPIDSLENWDIHEWYLDNHIWQTFSTVYPDSTKLYRGKILIDGLDNDTDYNFKFRMSNDEKMLEYSDIQVHTEHKDMTLEKGIYSCFIKSFETTKVVQGFGHDCAGVKEGMLLGNVLVLYGSVAKYNPDTWECSDYSEMQSHYYWVSDDVELWFEYHDEYDEGIEEIEVDDFNRYLSNGWVQLVITSDGEQITKLKIIWMP